ncbi:MAG: PTS sugar transporter subunit IIA [Spirochaetes bacterium]|nr:PTS sugar transporter subunit IIA [Spirochaetota bacterium]
MNLIEHIPKKCIQIGSASRSKEETLHEIAALLLKSNALSKMDEDVIYGALSERERIGSTAFGKSIAIPHCSLDEVEEFIIGLLVAKQGVDFGSLDKKPTRLFFCIVGPKTKRGEHIQILSSISKLLKTPDLTEKLVHAKNEEEVKTLLREIPLRREEAVEKKDKCLLSVFVQREETFDDILQTVSAALKGSVAVIEANNAGYYLHKLPLFASFWSEQTRISTRIIMAVVDKALSNDVIRRINLVVEGKGVLITVSDLSYTAGDIEF